MRSGSITFTKNGFISTIPCNLAFIVSVLFLITWWDFAFCQQKKVTVVFGNGEKVTLTDWTFVYHLKKGDDAFVKGKSSEVLKKKSLNLYLMERYDEENGKIDFDTKKEFSIDAQQLSSIKYFWNWDYGSSEKVAITLTDGTIVERVRLGPISTSIFGDEKFLYGLGIYLEGTYRVKGEMRSLSYNLDKWLRGAVPKEEIIVKIIFE